MTLVPIIGVFTISFLVSVLAIPRIIGFSKEKSLFDDPDDDRKLHTVPTPSLGGIAIVFGWLCGTMAFVDFSSSLHFFIIAGLGLLLHVVGIVDDLWSISPKVRFIVQFAIGIVCYQLSFSIAPALYTLGVPELHPIILGVVTILFISLIINAYNLIDGIDGLCGSLTTFAGAAFGVLFAWKGMLTWSFMSFALAGSTYGFLKYNFKNAKIFMGDNGSTFCGLIISLLFLKYTSHAAGSEGAVSGLFICISIIIIPVIDLLRVFFSRILNGLSPFHPDKTHLHHRMIKMFHTPQSVNIKIIAFEQVLFISMSLLLADYGPLTYMAFLATVLYLAWLGLDLSSGVTQLKELEKNKNVNLYYIE